jgi:hypothetical protein
MIPRFVVRRLTQTAVATFGNLEDDEGRVVCCTLEEPWVDANSDGISDRSVSCIPAGEYTAHRRLSPKRNIELFELDEVPGRSNIEIHVGNTTADTEGCILLGSAFGLVNGQNGITGSKPAFAKFMALVAGVDRIAIAVIDAPKDDGA